GLLDRVVVPSLGLAMLTQHLQLARDLWCGAQAARIGVARDQAQGLLLAVSANKDRGMQPTEALGEVERALQLLVLPHEGALVPTLAAPHPQADLERLLKPLEPLGKWGEGDAKPACLILVMTGPDTQPGTAAREHIQRSNCLGQ